MNQLQRHYERKAVEAAERLETGPPRFREGARLDLAYYSECAAYQPPERNKNGRRRRWQ